MRTKKKKNRSGLTILAVDPASEFGWALSKEQYGEWDLRTRKDESMGMKLIRLERKLEEIHEVHPLDLVVYERPAGRHKDPLIQHGKLVGTVEKWCERKGVQYSGHSPTEIKKYALGKGSGKGTDKKAMIKAAIKQYGYDGDNDNVADALHLLHMVKERLNV